MDYINPGSYEMFTRPIVQVWEGLLRRGKESKKLFNERSAQVESFYSGGAGAMWEQSYMARFMGSPTAIQPPKFKITMNVAFEHVALLGPLLFWEMAERKVRPHRTLQLDPMAVSGGDPQMAQYFEQLAQQQAAEDARNEMRARVLEHMLNYFQRELPGGGLSKHSELAIFEALTKGAGFLRTDDYKFPFSDKTLVGSTFVSADDILVDPDCRDPLWNTARWVAIRHVSKYYEVEEHFGLPSGSLLSYARLSTANAAYQFGSPVVNTTPPSVTKDAVEWYEIYSRAGMGNKLAGTREVILPEFDQARGDDFAYLCICPGCPFPLNLTGRDLVQDYATPEFVKQQTDWPTEYWRDNKWPVSMLSFYPHNGVSAWPEPPLAPALGELTILNILISAYVQQAYENRQQIIAHMKGAIENLPQLLQSTVSPLSLELIPGIHKSVNEVVQFMQRPEINNDIPETIQFVLELLEKRTGLSDMLYGGNAGANPRSATEYQGKMDTVNIRPEHMQKKVAAWQSEVADKEVLCAYIHVKAADIADALGPFGVVAWDELITNESPESILRGSKAFIEASGIRRPNKAKDMMDLQGMQQYLMPILAGYMTQTNDPGPLNGFIKSLGEAGEIETDGFLFPEPQPNPQMEQQQQAELAKLEAETRKLDADAQKTMAEAENVGSDNETKILDHQLKQQTAQQQMDLKERDAQLKAETKQQELQHKQVAHEQDMQMRQQEARQKLGLQLMQTHQKMQQAQATHQQQSGILDQKAQDDARRGNMIAYQKMLMARAEQQNRQQGSKQ